MIDQSSKDFNLSDSTFDGSEAEVKEQQKKKNISSSSSTGSTLSLHIAAYENLVDAVDSNNSNNEGFTGSESVIL
uniref:Uncharacterized protein n=1 Tax=Panagrolaimus sp. ES5 TaxID=591445 RepID=A0AC34GEX0_9BILA